MKKLILLIALLFVIDLVVVYYSQDIDPAIKTQRALSAVNGDGDASMAVRNYEWLSNNILLFVALSNVALILAFYWGNLKTYVSKLRNKN